MNALYIIIGIVVIWFFLGLVLEWFITKLFGIEPKSKIGKGILFVISLPSNLFFYLIAALSTAVIISIVWVFAKIFGKSKD